MKVYTCTVLWRSLIPCKDYEQLLIQHCLCLGCGWHLSGISSALLTPLALFTSSLPGKAFPSTSVVFPIASALPLVLFAAFALASATCHLEFHDSPSTGRPCSSCGSSCGSCGPSGTSGRSFSLSSLTSLNRSVYWPSATCSSVFVGLSTATLSRLEPFGDFFLEL